MQDHARTDDSAARAPMLNQYAAPMGRLRSLRWPSLDRRALAAAWRQLPWVSLVELALIAVWALWVGRRYLNFDPNLWLPGGDWVLNLEAYFVWTLLPKCGACVMWNGYLNGGAPAFVELVAALLHPVMIVGVLLWGVVNASKAAMLAGLIMAGVAQWWIADILRLGRLARIWSAALIVVGGHMAGRMDNGLVEYVLGVGSCSLAIAAGLELGLQGRRRSVVLLGLTTGVAMLAGQGYMQIGLVLCVMPGFLLFIFNRRLRLRPVWRGYLWAGVIAVLTSAVLWLPFLHFYPNFWKPFTDRAFADMPGLGFSLLYLVIQDPAIYDALYAAGLPAAQAWVANYIGWIPVALALVAVGTFPRRQWRVPAFFLAGIAMIYLVGSATLLRWIATFAPALVTSLRTPSVMLSLAVPLIVALAAWTVDRLSRWNWPILILTLSNRPFGRVSVMWIVLAPPLVWAVASAYTFGQRWFDLIESPLPFYPIIHPIDLDGQQWVATPFGESELAVVALQADLKLTDVVRPWRWNLRDIPAPYYELTRSEEAPADPNFLGHEYGLNKVLHPEHEYAVVDTGSERIPCRANAQGGHIDVDCQNNAAGTLTLFENSWTGWSVRRDGGRVPLAGGQWLSTEAPAGTHHYEFRYRPWDVPLGLALTLLGVGMSLWIWLASPRLRGRRGPAGA